MWTMYRERFPVISFSVHTHVGVQSGQTERINYVSSSLWSIPVANTVEPVLTAIFIKATYPNENFVPAKFQGMEFVVQR